MTQFNAWINPLICLAADSDHNNGAAPDPQDLLRYFVREGGDSSVDGICRRYEEIYKHARALFVAPRDAPYILDKIFWPLRHAISSYMQENYIGTIALSGMVSEMVAIVSLEMANLQINGHEISEDQQKLIFGRTYEKMGQEQRVKVLNDLPPEKWTV